METIEVQQDKDLFRPKELESIIHFGLLYGNGIRSDVKVNDDIIEIIVDHHQSAFKIFQKLKDYYPVLTCLGKVKEQGYQYLITVPMKKEFLQISDGVLNQLTIL